ncbi:MAG: methyltransferase domain-containing protein [bacterium]
MSVVEVPKELDQEHLRGEIQREYSTVATNPQTITNFHTGRRAAESTEYKTEWLACVPEAVLASFAGTGCPFRMGELNPGETVVDLGSGAGMDSFIAAHQVGPEGRVIGIDMTDEMLAKSTEHQRAQSLNHLEFRKGFLENLPIEDGQADVVISNGVVNLCPNKPGVFAEIFRILKPGGRMQIADIMVHKPVTDKMRNNIDLWTG